jgi:hypothetical protein
VRLGIVAGVDDLTSVPTNSVTQVQNVILHEKYVDAQTGGKDIALIQLKESWKEQICQRATLPEGASAWSLALRVAGFGVESGEGSAKSFVRADGTRFTRRRSEMRGAFRPAECADR